VRVRDDSFTVLVEELDEQLDIPFNLVSGLPVVGQPEGIPRPQNAALVTDPIHTIGKGGPVGDELGRSALPARGEGFGYHDAVTCYDC